MVEQKNKAIYLQIVDYAIEKILLQQWGPGEKLPGVRDLAIELEVNQNTILKALDILKEEQIIFDKRGVGYFLSDDVMKRVRNYKMRIFLNDELPSFLKSMYLLGISPQKISGMYTKYLNERE